MRAIIATLILTLLNAYVAHGFRVRLSVTGTAGWIALGLMAGFYVVEMIWPVCEFGLRGRFDFAGSELYTRLIQASFVALGVFSCLFVHHPSCRYSRLLSRIWEGGHGSTPTSKSSFSG